VLITPHSAFLTHEALANIAATTAANIGEFIEGKPLTNEIKA
jgi:D-lactate dehydrogenase